MTIKGKATLILKNHGVTEVAPGKYGAPWLVRGGKPVYVYLGRGYSLRKGPNKAGSVPIPVDTLDRWLAAFDRKAVTPAAKDENPLTVARRELHTVVGKLDHRQCETLTAVANDLLAGVGPWLDDERLAEGPQ